MNDTKAVSFMAGTNYERFDAVISGQMAIKNAMAEQFGSLQNELVISRDIQNQLLEKQQQMQEMQKHFDEKQQEMLNKQQQALDRLAVVQGRVNALLTQTYELHEYPIPRLFIVLPKVSKRSDKFTKPFSKQFRLYFLCEGGTHTTKQGGNVSHELHLAKHEGYDLDQPTKFFEKYGSYVLTMMEMIKLGLIAVGIAVPPLVLFKAADGIEMLQKSLGATKQSIGALVDETIKFIESQQNHINNGSDPSAGLTELDRAEALEGADLRQLESYLSIQDHGRVLGNLYRIATREGHIKWVCLDHYRENYRESTRQHLIEVVETNSGRFIEEIGKVEISITSNTIAKQFYEVLTKTRGIQELDIVLDWDASLSDLRKFAAAITTANIIHLTVNGKALKGPSFDVVNRGEWFNPVLHLAANGRIQSLRIQQFDRFFRRISTIPSMTTSRLRVLAIEGKRLGKDASLKILNKFLRKAQSMTELCLECSDLTGTFGRMSKMICDLQVHLKLRLLCRGCYVVTVFSQGVVESIEAKLDTDMLRGVHFEDLSQRGFLTKLQLLVSSSEFNFEDILDQNPKLSQVQFSCPAHKLLDLIVHIKNDTSLFNSGKGHPALRAIECQLDSNTIGDWEDSLPLDTIKARVDVLDNNQFGISIDMHASCFQDPHHEHELTELLRAYGWAVEKLDTGSALKDEQALVLDNITREFGSKLTCLVLRTRPLTDVGLRSMDQVIGRSGSLDRLCLYSRDLHILGEQQKLEHALCQHRKRLNGLFLTGPFTEMWPHTAARLGLVKRELPALDSLDLSDGWYIFSTLSSCQWISNLISTSPQESPTISNTQKPLKSIRITKTWFTAEVWKVIIEAVDFSGLESLTIIDRGFPIELVAVLVDCILKCDESTVPLRRLKLSATNRLSDKDHSKAWDMLSKIREKAPQAKIDLQ
ncbi:hypothetical protein BGX34_009728 [Mortierella sp. NVP85]|nr:hypothetical protein BGX34_009728 [Mortierella sp. NVP85]